MFEVLPLVKLILALITLLLASRQDWEKREIEDKLWLVLGFGGGAMTAFELINAFNSSIFLVSLLSFGLSFLLGYLLFYLGFFGGADAKAIWALGITFPSYPKIPYIFPSLPIYNFFILTVLGNSLILSILSVFYYSANNLSAYLKGENLFLYEMPTWKKLILFFTAVKISIHEADWRKIFPVEKVDFSKQPPQVEVELLSRVDEEIDVDSLLRGVEEGILSKRIWVSPGIPMILFILMGLVVSIFFGDLILYTVFGLLETLF